MIRSSLVVSAAALACAMSSTSFAQGAANNPYLRFSQEHHWTFSEIGDVGNAPYSAPNPGSLKPRLIGSVDHRYRISTTEVSWNQYYEFVLAYAPIAPLNIGTNLHAPGVSPFQYAGVIDGVPRYVITDPSRMNEPAGQNWQLWARFTNWLNAGGPDLTNPTSADFENGAYDTSTFGRIADGPTGPYFTDQDEHTPGARFWIPSYDELVKATYYDPNQDGQGNGGYWQFGHSSDSPPVPGDPALGGETNAGGNVQYPEGQFRPLDVGSYPDVLSPWGLLDTVGGQAEMTETWDDDNPFEHNQRRLLAAHTDFIVELGDIDHLGQAGPLGQRFGLRLAAAIPAPSTLFLFGIPLTLSARRRR
jgi:hypothetical protein